MPVYSLVPKHQNKGESTQMMINLLSLGLFEPFSVKTLPLTVETFLFGLMIVAGVLYGYYVYKLHADSFSAWLKPLVLIMGGGYCCVFRQSAFLRSPCYFHSMYSRVLLLVSLCIEWPDLTDSGYFNTSRLASNVGTFTWNFSGH